MLLVRTLTRSIPKMHLARSLIIALTLEPHGSVMGHFKFFSLKKHLSAFRDPHFALVDLLMRVEGGSQKALQCPFILLSHIELPVVGDGLKGYGNKHFALISLFRQKICHVSTLEPPVFSS